ncbi:MAG: hypothetical protein H7329_17675 [Opitutaceae bacterium]|nr:hypothetical protein [Cytophagales bacterium]
MDWTASLVKELRETWIELKQDKFMKGIIKLIALLFSIGLIINLTVFVVKSFRIKPSSFIGIPNGIEPEIITKTVIKRDTVIVYIRDTFDVIGRDKYDIKGNPNINTR